MIPSRFIRQKTLRAAARSVFQCVISLIAIDMRFCWLGMPPALPEKTGEKRGAGRGCALGCRGRCRSQPFATKERYGCGSAACRYTSARWEVTNSPKIPVKSVHPAGGQSRPPLQSTGDRRLSVRNSRVSQSKGSWAGARLCTGPAQASRHDPRRSGWSCCLYPGENALQRQPRRLWRKRLEKDTRVLRQHDSSMRGTEKLTGHL